MGREKGSVEEDRVLSTEAEGERREAVPSSFPHLNGRTFKERREQPNKHFQKGEKRRGRRILFQFPLSSSF